MFQFMFWLAVVVLVVAIALLWRTFRPAFLLRQSEEARRQFEEQREAIQSQFFERAASSGKPRGLRWVSCAFRPDLVLTRDQANGELIGLVGVTIGFEAVEGGGMEDVEAVGNLRAATAVFMHDGRHWTTAGRAVFNLEPHEVLERYRSSLAAAGTSSDVRGGSRRP